MKELMENKKLNEGWEIKKIEDLSNEKKAIVSGPFGSNLKVVDYREVGVPMIRLQNVGKGYFIDKSIKYVTKRKAEELKSHSFNAGDIVLAKLGIPIGKTCIIPKYFGSGIIVADIVRIRPDKNIANYKFVEYFLNTDLAVSQLNKNISGATRPRVNLSDVRNIFIPLPPLKEQKQIVTILDKAFATIDKAKTNAEQNLLNAKQLFESYLQNVFVNGKLKVENGEWVEKTLGEVLQKTKTVNPKLNPNDEFIYLDVSSVNKETKLIEKTTTLLGKDAPSRARKLVETDDVIFATVRPTHSRVAIITKEYNNQVCSTGYYVLKAKEYLNNHFVFYFLLTYGFNKKMESMQKGASYPAVTNKEVESVLIPYPKTIQEQQKIVKKLDTLQTQTKKLERTYQQKIIDLEELKKSLLQKAFSGELTN